jgi:hypothetical protein
MWPVVGRAVAGLHVGAQTLVPPLFEAPSALRAAVPPAGMLAAELEAVRMLPHGPALARLPVTPGTSAASSGDRLFVVGHREIPVLSVAHAECRNSDYR